MNKKLLSLLLLAVMALCPITGCTPPSSDSTDSSSGSQIVEQVDYAGQLKLDMNSDSLKLEVTVKTYIDGDTTHFNVPKTIDEHGLLKARYIAVNTPESTGKVEPWGKKASNFTKGKLQSASSIIIESNGSEWEVDSTGDRHLVWVWYKPNGSTDYRNLNLEILQNGLAFANKSSDSRYGETCAAAFNQAKSLNLHVFSKEKDPDFYYGSAIELDLKELRTNIEEYNGMRVAFEATATVYNDWSIYLEDYDAESGISYGITAFYGYESAYHSILAPGNRVRIVGNVSYYEAGGTYQISALKYSRMDPKNPDNIQKLSEGHSANYPEMTIPEFNSNITVNREVLDEESGEMITVPTTFKYADVAISTSISMKNLKVVEAYTTNNGGNNQGAISLTCQDANGNEIVVRTAVLMENGVLVTQDRFLDKTIDVKGMIDVFNGEYQIKVFWVGDITIH